jgi:hypothetical protein
MQDDERRQLIELFIEAGQAHGKAHIQTNGEDAEWPIWYADHLKDNLERATGKSFTRSELIYFLVLADRKQRAEGKARPWPEFYADLMLAGNP